MKKVLLVDDEPAIREGLSYLIDWEALGYKIQAIASDGEEGLKKIKLIQPDLIISDIRMPEMDGLEMIQKAKALGYQFQSIILSGYSEFEYAQKAIQLGSVSYLLKPIDEEELIRMLKKIHEKEEKDTNTQLINKLFGNDEKGLSTTGLIRLLSFTKKEIRDEIAQHIHLFPTISIGHGGRYYLVLLREEQKEFRQLAEFEKIMVETLKKSQTVILDSSWQTSNQNLANVVNEVKSLEKQSFFYPHQYLSKKEVAELIKGLKHTESIHHLLAQSLMNQKDWSFVWQAYQDNFLLQPITEATELKWRVVHDISLVLEILTNETGGSFEYDGTHIYQLLETLESFSSVMNRVADYYQQVRSKMIQNISKTDIICEIKNYTKEHYGEELTLKSISEKFSYDSAYLGKKFKRICGETYLSYLENYRMKKAKELLEQTNLMVYEIAEKTGYNNVNYFHKKFKTRYKSSPNEYRRMNTE